MESFVLRDQLEDLYARYVGALDDGELELWPELFTEHCLYLILPRDNHERGLPLAVMRCESRDMLKDRITAIRETMMYEQRYLRHHVTNIRVRAAVDDALEVSANFSVIEVLPDDLPRVAMVGRYLDKLVVDAGGEWLFTEKLCIYDSLLVANSIIYPV